MGERRAVLRYLREEAEKVVIPESITPEQVRKKLEMFEYGINMKTAGSDKNLENTEAERTPENIKAERTPESTEAEGTAENSSKYRKQRRRKDTKNRYYILRYIAAACLCLLVGTVYTQKSNFIKLWEGGIKPYLSAEDTSEPVWTGGEIVENNNKMENVESENEEIKEGSTEVIKESELSDAVDYPEITYEDIYESMFGDLEELEIYNSYRGTSGSLSATPTINEAAESIVFKEYEASDGTSAGVLPDSAVSEKSAVEGKAEVEEKAAEYGSTNVQTVGVDEGDVVKNDGRYLYQKIYQEKDHVFTQAIQIVDTNDGLKEVKRIEGFENIQEFYVWEDILVIIENKYLQTVQTNNTIEGEMVVCGTEDMGSYNRYYHEITFYNMKDRSMPYKIKTFTLKGRYDSSRISDGYFYGFSKFYANPGKGKDDYGAYIPLINGTRLEPSQILLPEENKGNCYLVLVSVDLKNPTKFAETTAIVTDSDMYYVSSNNIYIVDSLGLEEGNGRKTNRISLLRFSYGNGCFALQAEGEVPGSLESSFSMDEYGGNLRMVTTVDEYWIEIMKDDRTGEILGNHVKDIGRTNALYVLDQNLEIIGRIENLAEEEQIYSARFLGETGYFVTFRQTDPLFAVDLKDPEKPKILSELKISGFSEYLHFYGEDRLLGIGMEADEETGSTEGMKLSMFDISDPARVTEIDKFSLSSYYYSEGLYNHRAVLISAGANIFGFEAEGHENGNYKKNYLVFSYENEEFVQKMKLETNNRYGKIYSSRGTFIGNVFYLLTGDGSITSYDLNTGKMLEKL